MCAFCANRVACLCAWGYRLQITKVGCFAQSYRYDRARDTLLLPFNSAISPQFQLDKPHSRDKRMYTALDVGKCRPGGKSVDDKSLAVRVVKAYGKDTNACLVAFAPSACTECTGCLF
jgi:hypothetical protein